MMTVAPSLFDYVPPAIAARDAALAQVEGNNQEWSERAYIQTIDYLRHSKFGQEFSGETLRTWLEPSVGKMPSAGCMGALTMRLVRSGFIRKTGRYEAMKSEKSHGRETKIYCFGIP